ncbi:MAG: DUF362 domain-containing protein [Verrucomicrobia bacterium]|nr:DUF362 domain-containing protein [Verrucomicrobiota bacterium]
MNRSRRREEADFGFNHVFRRVTSAATKLRFLGQVIALAFLVPAMLALKPTFGEPSTLLSPWLAKRARVFVVEDLTAIRAFNPQPERIQAMVDRGLEAVTGRNTVASAWRNLVSTQDVVGIKVFSSPGPTSGTRPAVVAAVVKSLLDTGFPAAQIVVWDKQIADLQRAGFLGFAERFGIRVAGSADEGYDEKTFYDTSLIGKLVWGDFEFGKKGEGVGRNSYVSKLVTKKITKIINVTPLLNHNLAGVSGNLFGLAFGSVDNILRFESGPQHLASAIPEIYALPELGDRVVLNIVDALICQYQGDEKMYLQYSAMLGQLRFSADPVALDVLSIDELNRQRQLAKIPPVIPNFQIYTNASQLELGVSDFRGIDLIKGP